MTVSLSMPVLLPAAPGPCSWPLAGRRESVGREDDVRRLDHRGDLRASLQAELLDRLDGDRGHQAGAARVEFDVGDGLAGVDAGDAGGNLVTGAQRHRCTPWYRCCVIVVLRLYATRGPGPGRRG